MSKQSRSIARAAPVPARLPAVSAAAACDFGARPGAAMASWTKSNGAIMSGELSMLPGDRAAPLIRTLMPSLNASGTGAFYRSIGVASKLHAAKGRTPLPEPIGVGEWNRTLVIGLGSLCSTIELHPHASGEF